MSNLKQEVMEHYERLLNCSTWMQFSDEGWNARSCPLCQNYPDCDGCPVKNHTGFEECLDTPWPLMNSNIQNFQFQLVSLEEVRESIQKEKDFLESLDYPDN